MRPEAPSFSFPKPGKGLIGLMAAVTCVWVVLAVSGNWVGADVPAYLAPFVGDTDKVLGLQLWRLFTAPLIHTVSGPGSPGHLLTTLMGLYFLGTPLEERWGTRRMLLFLFGSAALAFALQVVIGALVPSVKADTWFGGLGMVEAVAVAWALSSRGQTVRLFFVLPVTPMMLLGFIFVMSVLNLLSRNTPQEGLLTPFGGMLAGYLLSDASPLRRLLLRLRLNRLQQRSAALRAPASRSAGHGRGAAPLRIVHGGAKEPPKDKRFLN